MFRTEREIYDRLRWDPRFDLRRCHIVFTVRPSGEQRVPFLEHAIGVVPWHRIIEFWIDDELAWSRPQRIDRFDELAAIRAASAGALPAVGAVALEPHVFAGGGWTPGRAARAAAPPSPSLRVVTWNLLFDRYDPELLRSDERWQDALDRLAAVAADVIALVEVTPKIWARVLAQPWVRDYVVSHGPDAPHLAPFGQAVLSRYPLRDAHVLELARRRTAVVATLELADARAIGVVALHLSSDKTADAAVLRGAQLAEILGHVGATSRAGWILAGDFNAAPEVHAAELVAAGACDAWEVVRPGEPGHTFDAVGNALAAAMTSTGRSARLDRIHTIGLPASAARLIGVEPGPIGVPPSDHYGVCVELGLAAGDAELDLRVAPTTRRSALAIVPPVAVWGAIQRIRCEADRGFGRWPPHVTLAHPFVDSAWLAPAIAALRKVVAELEPFEVVLDRVAAIAPGAGHRTIVVFPDRRSAHALGKLHAAIRAVIPDRETAAYLPHLTLARDRDPRTIPPLAVRWRVDRLAILGDDAGRFEVAHELMFGGAPAPARAAAIASHEPVVAAVREAAQVVDPSATVAPFGSILYAPAFARDLDLVVEVDAGVDATAHELAQLLGLAAAGAGHLRGEVGGRAVELSIVSRGAPDERVLAGPRDGQRLAAHLRDHGRHDAFLAAWPSVLRFVHARALAGNGLGFFGSFGWAMLLAIPLCHDAVLCTAADPLPGWFAWLAGIAPGTRLGLDAAAEADPAPLWLAAPGPPSRNVARGVTAGTLAALRDELRRAARLGDLARIAIDLHDEPPPGTPLAITGDPASRGAYERRFRGLLLELEAALGLVVRPWGRFELAGAAWRHHLTLGAGANVPAARDLIARWLAEVAPTARLV